MRKVKKIIIILLIVFIVMLIINSILSVIIVLNQKNKNKVTKEENKKETTLNSLQFKIDYEKLNGTRVGETEEIYKEVNIDEYNPIKYVNLEELVEIVNNQDAYIYISSTRCPYCRSTIEELLKVVKDLNIETLYYYDPSSYEKSDRYDELIQQLVDKDIVMINEEGNKRWGTPLVIKTKQGIAEEVIRGVTYKLNEGQSIHDDLTDEQKEIVYNNYYEKLS